VTEHKWPSFETWDIADLPEYEQLYQQRWETYDREMKALIAKGGVHQDEDGWWVDDASGELIGPDPEIERPLTDEEWAQMRPLEEVNPELAAALRSGVGSAKTQPVEPLSTVKLLLDPATIARFEAKGPEWRRRMEEIIKKAET